MGHRGHGYEGTSVVYGDKKRRGRTSKSTRRWMRHPSAIKSTIGHLKSSKRLDKNRLKGPLGDKLNVILSAAGMDFHEILKALANTPGSLALFLAAGTTPALPERHPTRRHPVNSVLQHRTAEEHRP